MNGTVSTIGIDVSGGDSPDIELLAAFLETRPFPECKLHVYIATPQGSDLSLLHELLEYHKEKIVACTQADTAIYMEDSPYSAVRRKKSSSLMLALQDLRERRIEALITTANTGAVVLASSVTLGRIKGVRSPALAVEIPSQNRSSPCIFLDTGASVEIRERDIPVFSILGAAYMKALFAVSRPTVALFNIGIEPIKGTKKLRMIHEIFRENQHLLPFDFIGNVEPDDVFSEKAPNVVVSGGFAGNVFLKTAEALLDLAKVDIQSLQGIMQNRPVRQAAILSGVRGLVFKCHGKARASSAQSALHQAVDTIQGSRSLIDVMEKAMVSYDPILQKCMSGVH